MSQLFPGKSLLHIGYQCDTKVFSIVQHFPRGILFRLQALFAVCYFKSAAISFGPNLAHPYVAKFTVINNSTGVPPLPSFLFAQLSHLAIIDRCKINNVRADVTLNVMGIAQNKSECANGHPRVHFVRALFFGLTRRAFFTVTAALC